MLNQDFRRELCALLNRFGIDTQCAMPDFLLADYIADILQDLANVRRRLKQFFRTHADPE